MRAVRAKPAIVIICVSSIGGDLDSDQSIAEWPVEGDALMLGLEMERSLRVAISRARRCILKAVGIRQA